VTTTEGEFLLPCIFEQITPISPENDGMLPLPNVGFALAPTA
jgi:hypothetical protein